MTAIASPSVRAANAALLGSLPFDDDADFEDAGRGFLGRLDPCVIRAADGRVVWDNESYRFVTGDAPDTVNPSLWRQSILVAMDGLFEVVPGIYQARGLDLSNITFVEGETGVLVIDPLISTETAAAALALYREHRGDRPVVGVVYTHSHIDHFGGVKGVTSQADVDAGRCVVIAPEGFVEHSVAENVYAGPGDGAPGGLHVRGGARAEPARPGGRRAGPDHVDRHGHADPADRHDHDDRRRARRRRHPDGVPGHAGHRGAGRDEPPVPGPRGALHGREHDPHAAQPAHPARRPGPRPERLGALHHRGDRPVRGPQRRRLRLAPLAHLGPGPAARLPGAAARPVRVPARPDAADAQQGDGRRRDRRGDRAAARPGARLARPRLLRLGQPQREGDLPALHGLVRRQPGAPLAAHADRGRHPVRGRHGRRGRGAARWRARRSRPATSAGSWSS